MTDKRDPMRIDENHPVVQLISWTILLLVAAGVIILMVKGISYLLTL